MPDSRPEIKVMLVDDSAVIRGLLTRALEKEPRIRIVSSVPNGQMAVNAVTKADPDVIVLDIEMPEMDGMTALPLLQERKPGVKILMCSTLSRQGAAISMRALALGATECLVKPTSTSEIGGSADFQSNLVRLILSLGAVHRSKAAAPATTVAAARPKIPHNFTLRDGASAYSGKPAIIAIGSSTGGPQALFETLKHLKALPVPLVITQHMPKTFTAILAEHIERNCGFPCSEAAEGMRIEPGCGYVAPGGFHLELHRKGAAVLAQITDGPPENYCKPSVEPMMRSIVNIYGNKCLGVMLTGMGSDGLEGFRLLAQKGGQIIAQDEESSVVWGMPGAVATAGLCTEVLPLKEIGPRIAKML